MSGEGRLGDGALKGLRDALKASEPPSVHPGDTVGRYQVESIIGRGGAGVIYRAYDAVLERTVALKVLRSDVLGPGRLARFYREASAAARLAHPNIVKIHEVVMQEGLHFISMEFVEGQTLAELFKKGRVPREKVCAIMETVARAVHYAHEMGVVHRDLKPHNILLRPDGTPVLTDFGLAKVEDGQTTLTQTGFILGTPLYMSPEQVSGVDTIDFRTDVYSLGVILFEGLTGRAPFTGQDPAQLYRRILEQDPPSLRQLEPSLPAQLEAITLHCLQKDRAKRYATALELAQELNRWRMGESVVARAPAWTHTAVRFLRRNHLYMLMAVCLLVALVPLALFFMNQGEIARMQRLQKFHEAEKETIRALAGGKDAAAVLKTLEQLRTDHPADPRPLVWAARLHLRLGDEAACEAALREALRRDPKDPEAHLDSAGLLLRRYHRGRAVFSGFFMGGKMVHLRFAPESKEAADLRLRAEEHLAQVGAAEASGAARDFAEGAMALARGKTSAAAEHLRRHVDQASWDTEAFRLAARVHYVASQLDRAEEILRRATALAPENLDLLIDLGRVLSDSGQFEAALRVFEEAMTRHAKSARLLTAYGQTHNNLVERHYADNRAQAAQHYAKALAAFDQALQIEPRHLAAWSGRGDAHLIMRKPAEAIKDLTQALEVDPQHLPSLMNRGKAHSALGQFEPAIADCTRALRIDPNNAWILSVRARAYLVTQRYPEAVADFQQSLALFPDSAETWMFLGLARHALQDYAGAIDAHTRALEIDPKFAPAYHNRAGARYSKGDHEGSIADLGQALKLQPDEPGPLGLRGTIYFRIAEGAADPGARQRALQACVRDLQRFLEIETAASPIVAKAKQTLQRAREMLSE